MSWSLHASKRPVTSIAASQVLAAGEAVDEGIVLKQIFSTLLDINVELIIALDSSNIYISLKTQRKAAICSVRSNVNYNRYAFERGHANPVLWISGRLILTDPGTKSESPLADALQLLLFSGRLPHAFP